MEGILIFSLSQHGNLTKSKVFYFIVFQGSVKSYSISVFSHFLQDEAWKDAYLDALMVDKTKTEQKKLYTAARCGRISRLAALHTRKRVGNVSP